MGIAADHAFKWSGALGLELNVDNPVSLVVAHMDDPAGLVRSIDVDCFLSPLCLN